MTRCGKGVGGWEMGGEKGIIRGKGIIMGVDQKLRDLFDSLEEWLGGGIGRLKGCAMNWLLPWSGSSTVYDSFQRESYSSYSVTD